MAPAPPITFSRSRSPSSNKVGTNWWERVVVQRSAYAVDALVESLTDRSRFLREAAPPGYPPSLAVVNREEVQIGDLLGRGTYSEVYEVAGLELSDSDDDDEDFVLTDIDGGQLNISSIARATRHALQQKAASNNSGNHAGNGSNNHYAIKHLRPDLLKDSKSFESAAADLIMEAKFLSMMDHPNILKMRGIAMGGTAAYACSGLYDSFFVIVDRIHETLNERIRDWRMDAGTHLCNPNNNTLILKLDIALQLGDALSYLHERRLVFRDLKPHNCGLTKNGKVQLFDFGFCRELPQESDDTNPAWGQEQAPGDDARLYGMSGKGTLMYMSPEALGTRRYNQKADVYGWSIILYEMLTLRRPYAIDSVEGHRRTIYRRGERPPLGGTGMPRTLQHLLENCWDANIARRYTMQEGVLHLEHILSNLSAPGFLAQVGDIENCMRILLSPVEGMLTSLYKDVQTGLNTLKQEMTTTAEQPRPAKRCDDAPPMIREAEALRPYINQTMPTQSSSSESGTMSSLSIRAESFGLVNEGRDDVELEESKTPVVADDQMEIEVVMGPTPSDITVKSVNLTSMSAAVDERSGVVSLFAQETRRQSTRSNQRYQRNRRQAPRGHHGTLLYHAYYGRRARGRGGKKETAGDKLYKDRLLRTIHSVHGTEPRTVASTSKKQVVSPSA